MRTFKLRPRTPAQIISRDAVVTCLEAREAVNRAILEHGAFSDAATSATNHYKATRRTATKALRAAGAVVAKRRVARFGGLPSTSAGLSAELAPAIRTEAEVLADALTAGRRMNLEGSELEAYLWLVTRPDSQLAKVLQQTA